MPGGRDDEALSWSGDDDPTLDVGSRPPLPDGFTAVGKGSESVGTAQDDPADANAGDPRRAMGNATLVTLGIVAGVLLLYTIGWIIGGLRLAGAAQFLVSPVGYQFALWLAIAAPALWFASTLVLTRASKAWVRIAWLVGGLALLVPWPFIMIGAVGQ